MVSSGAESRHGLQYSCDAARLLEYACGNRLLDGAFLVAHLADAKELNCSGLDWRDEEARRFAAALEHATAHGALKALEKLYLGWNQIGDEGVRHLGDALARGAAPALELLDLRDNNIGDEGMRHLGDALARGAAPALEKLGLDGNPASDAAKLVRAASTGTPGE